MKLYTYVATLWFEAKDEEEAKKLLGKYLENGDCELYEIGSWSLGDLTDLEEDNESFG
jgi:hypothetical protein